MTPSSRAFHRGRGLKSLQDRRPQQNASFRRRSRDDESDAGERVDRFLPRYGRSSGAGDRLRTTHSGKEAGQRLEHDPRVDADDVVMLLDTTVWQRLGRYVADARHALWDISQARGTLPSKGGRVQVRECSRRKLMLNGSPFADLGGSEQRGRSMRWWS